MVINRQRVQDSPIARVSITDVSGLPIMASNLTLAIAVGDPNINFSMK